MIPRTISRILNPPVNQGFLGPGHTAASVLDGLTFEQTDPFILLMDDQLRLVGTEPVGGPHPHAGFETVTLVLEGDQEHEGLKTGDLEWMTAGSGIVHTEEMQPPVNLRILQLWLTLPKAKRWTAPKLQKAGLESIPVQTDGDTEIRVYSGTALGMTAPTHNQTPVTLVDYRLESGHEIRQELPASYNGFIYVLAGNVETGPEKTMVETGQMAWLDRPQEQGDSQIEWKAGKNGARFILYAGEPQGVPIVQHGPFIADTKDDIVRLYTEYRQGHMGHVQQLPEDRTVHHPPLSPKG